MSVSRIPRHVPRFLYRAFKEERCAREFVEQGKIRLGNIQQYKRAVDATADPDEGSAEYLAPLPGLPVEFIPNRHEILNSIFLLCMSGPGVEWSVLTQFGQHIVRINDPRALYRDVREFFGKIAPVELLKVRYTRHQRLHPRLDDCGKHRLTYSQKAKRFSPEREWRIALIATNKRYPPEAYALAIPGKRLDYCQLLPLGGPAYAGTA